MARLADFATLPRNFAIIAAFNAAIAAGVAFASRGSFGESMVYSQCIGFAIYLPIDVTRRLLWGAGRPPQRQMLALAAAGIVFGFVAGLALAATIVGRPLVNDRIFTTIAIAAFAGIAGNWYFWSRERAQTIERGAAEARLKLLQAQIEPHFLFNTLANLHTLIASDPARAQRMLEHLNDYLRATLGAARRDSGTLGEEFELLRGYLEVLKIRMGARLSYGLSIPGELESFKIPPMLLQPLVENAIKHGLEPKVEGGRVDVSVLGKNDFVEIRISDSGLGMGNSATKGSGVGLAHVRERLAAVYGPTASLAIAGDGGGATVTVRIPR